MLFKLRGIQTETRRSHVELTTGGAHVKREDEAQSQRRTGPVADPKMHDTTLMKMVDYDGSMTECSKDVRRSMQSQERNPQATQAPIYHHNFDLEFLAEY